MASERLKAELRRLHSPDVRDLEKYTPDGPFGILVQAMIGPLGRQGEESFDIVVCTPDWFAEHMRLPIVSGRHFLFVVRYCYEEIWGYVMNFCASCEGATWPEVAQRVGRLGKWEFEDYES